MYCDFLLFTESVFATNVGKKDFPLVVVEFPEAFLVGLADGGKLDRVEAKLLQVHQVQIPAQVCHEIVKSYTGSTEEAMVIRAY